MSKSGKDKQVSLVIDSEVVRQIRKHARSAPKTEVCGVLIGEIQDGVTRVDACISGVNAAQGGAHVTFTQDTWEHIYKIKDRDFPDARMVGWYHSHPGFGIFLSDHDTFIHKNFFSAPEQVAWVFDPVSDEEGCFGWRGSWLERIARYSFQDEHGGEPAHLANRAESAHSSADDEDWSDAAPQKKENAGATDSDDVSRLARTATLVFSHLAVLLIGGLLVWYLLPHYVGIPIPVDPQTGQPIKEFMDRLRGMAPGAIPPSLDTAPNSPSAPSAAPAPGNAQPAPPPAPDSRAPQTKGNDGHR
jgi:proteasome lid subunit RPN8/RPN11